MSAIAVTGIGAVLSTGVGCDSLESALRSAAPKLSAIDPDPGMPAGNRRASLAALVGNLSTKDRIPPLVARRMSAPSRFAVVAAKDAARDARLDFDGERDPARGTALATAFGPVAWTERILDQILGEGPAFASPALFTECVANAPAGQVAIQCGAAGPNHTICQREAGPLLAVSRAATEIRNGRAKIMLAGGVEEMTPLLHGCLDRLRSLARGNGGRPEAARPFDRRRNGLVAAEGSAVLVLEREDDASRRGATPLARLRGHAAAFDPSATRAGWGTGAEALAAGLRRALASASVRPDEVDLVVSGASGSIAGDRLEARVLREVWGDGLPPVVAPKGVTGEYGGGFLAAAVLAAAGRAGGPAAGFREADPDLGVVPCDGGALPAPRVTLVTTLASGGAAAWLVLERP